MLVWTVWILGGREAGVSFQSAYRRLEQEKQNTHEKFFSNTKVKQWL